MASNTENLNLLMKNPSTDGADTFNVQTMLNENWQKIDNNAGTVAQTLANILKPTTPPIIGLPPSTTPDGMFQALGNTGELHVWRKTVVNASEKPAGYTLGAETKKTLGLTKNNDSSSWAITVELASSVSVDDAGNVTLVSPTKRSIYAYNEFSDLFSGKFFRMYSIGGYVTESELYNNEVYFVPSGNKLTLRADTSGSKFYLDLGMKLVTGYAKTPAGTTTTYPVSTNPNAYQEGDDAKPAGYTLGEVETGKFALARGVDYTVRYANSNGIKVNDDGTFNLPSDLPLTGANSSTMLDNAKVVIGRTIQQTTTHGSAYTDFPQGKTYFIPSDATTGSEGSTSYDITNYVTKRQLVTGYAAIPAGTTIEYLGKLGDKARVQVVSYVGTGTYGESNPNSLTFDFVPKMVIIRANGAAHVFIYTLLFLPGTLTKTFQENGYVNLIGDSEPGLSDAYARVSGRTLAWYAANSYSLQANYSGAKYTAIAIG